MPPPGNAGIAFFCHRRFSASANVSASNAFRVFARSYGLRVLTTATGSSPRKESGYADQRNGTRSSSASGRPNSFSNESGDAPSIFSSASRSPFSAAVSHTFATFTDTNANPSAGTTSSPPARFAGGWPTADPVATRLQTTIAVLRMDSPQEVTARSGERYRK